jgi:hypothetical protein
MKQLLLLLLVVLATISCSKKDDLTPTVPLPGTYTINRMIDTQSNLDLTLPTVVSGQAIAGTIVVTQPSSERIAFEITLRVAGSVSSQSAAEATLIRI